MAYQTQNLEHAVKTLMPDYMGRPDVKDDPVLKRFPFQYKDADQVVWAQWDNQFGIAPLRGLGAKPDVVQFPDWKRFTMAPGYFGFQYLLGESLITKGVQPGTLHDPIDVADLIGMLAINGSVRILNRVKKTAVDLCSAGRLDIQDAVGRRFQYTLDGYAARIKVPGTSWSSPATATPIKDTMTWQAELQAGTDSRFGRDSVWVMNSNTLAEFFAIQQILGTLKTDYGATVNGLAKYNEEIAGRGSKGGFSLPQIEVFDDGYYPDGVDASNPANFVKFLANRTILWFGTRPDGQQAAQFQLTRHAGLVTQADGSRYPSVPVPDEGASDLGKGLYVRCKYQDEQPHGYKFDCGFNGMPVMPYPTAFACIQYT